MRKIARAATLAALSLSSALAFSAPVTIGFEGVVAPNDSVLSVIPYTESGYTMGGSAPQFATGIFGANVSNSNGSATFVFCSFDSSCAPGTFITLTGASPFSLLSIDVGIWQRDDVAGMIDLIGHQVGGGTVTSSLAAAAAWSSYGLSGFSNLQSVEFRGRTSYAVAFDNLVLDAGRTLPEPSSFALVGAALCGIVGVARRKRA